MNRRQRWLTALAAAYFLLAGSTAAVAAGLTLRASGDVDLVFLFGMSAAAILLIGSGLWLVGSRRRIPAVVVPPGALVGILAGLAPLAAAVSLIGASYVTSGPLEVGFPLALLAWAIGSAAIAIRAWRTHRAGVASNAPLPARR